MTERRTNRLLGGSTGFRTAPFVEVNGEPVPTEIHAYCEWLNSHERRRGVWVVADEEGRKAVVWREEVATDDWLRECGLIPKLGKAA